MATKAIFRRNSTLLLLLPAFIFMLSCSLCESKTRCMAESESKIVDLKMHVRRAETLESPRNHTGRENETNDCCPCVCSCNDDLKSHKNLQEDTEKVQNRKVQKYVLDFTLNTLIVVILGSFFMFRKSHYSIHVVMVTITSFVYYLCLAK